MAAFMPVLTKYGGRVLAADEQPGIVEGQWNGDKVVILAFPDEDTFTAWADSSEYQEISKDRRAAAEGSVLLVHGLA